MTDETKEPVCETYEKLKSTINTHLEKEGERWRHGGHNSQDGLHYANVCFQRLLDILGQECPTCGGSGKEKE